MRADVIDVSHYQNVTDNFRGAKMLGVRAVIAKATEGSSYRDPAFQKHRVLAASAGLLFGAYHYIRPGDPERQADFFLATVGDTADTVLVLDWEDPTVPISAAQRFAQRVFDHTGRYVVMYSYSQMLRGLSQMSPERKLFWRKTKLWVANYSKSAQVPDYPADIWPTWWLWQFTGDGNGQSPHDIPGVGIHVDVSTYHGDAADLAQDWARPVNAVWITEKVKPAAPPAAKPTIVPPANVPARKGLLSEFLRKFLKQS